MIEQVRKKYIYLDCILLKKNQYINKKKNLRGNLTTSTVISNLNKKCYHHVNFP